MNSVFKHFASRMLLGIYKLEKIKICSINKTIISLLIVIGSIQISASVKAQEIAIVKNFDDPEIDSLQSYLNSMGLNSKTFNNETLAYDSVAVYNLLIWDDLGFQSGGLSDSNVSVFNQFYQSGKPLYFIGDDIAFSIINLSQEWAPVWTNLVHLSGVNNYSQSYTVVITNTTHPVTDGYYGQVKNFDYNLDIDLAIRTYTGEIVLATTTDSDVLLANEGIFARTVTQNCLVIQAGSDSSITERKKLFRNAVAWLLSDNTGIGVTGSLNTAFSLYPNPAYDIVTLNICNGNNADLTLNIFNVIGELVRSELLKQNQQKINIGDLNNGIYIVEINSNEWSGKQKLIIQR